MQPGDWVSVRDRHVIGTGIHGQVMEVRKWTRADVRRTALWEEGIDVVVYCPSGDPSAAAGCLIKPVDDMVVTKRREKPPEEDRVLAERLRIYAELYHPVERVLPSSPPRRGPKRR